MSAEHRKYVRINSKNVLRCERIDSSAPETNFAFTRNISAGGFLFDSLVLYKMGERIRLVLRMPGLAEEMPSFTRWRLSKESDVYIVNCTVVRTEFITEGVYAIGVSVEGMNDTPVQSFIRKIKSVLRRKKK